MQMIGSESLLKRNLVAILGDWKGNKKIKKIVAVLNEKKSVIATDLSTGAATQASYYANEYIGVLRTSLEGVTPHQDPEIKAGAGLLLSQVDSGYGPRRKDLFKAQELLCSLCSLVIIVGRLDEFQKGGLKSARKVMCVNGISHEGYDVLSTPNQLKLILENI